jgi:high affinity Mn2+ porin
MGNHVAGIYAFMIGKRARWRWTWCGWLAAMLLLVAVAVPFARGQDSPPPDQPQGATDSKPPGDQRWNLHFQSTVLGQWAAPFPAEYSGGNSLEPHGEVKDTFSFDVTAGIRLWRGGEFFADVLTWQGYGLSKTTGLAGFPNGEAYRLGKTYPDVIVARGYLRETVPLGGGPSPGADPNAGSKGERRLILSVGHIPVTDVFDKNAYANDPRAQFMNWAFVNNAAWDYPANSLGFSNGVSAEFDLGSWTARTGIFQDSQFANALRMDWNLLHAWSLAEELEKRHSFRGHPGAARLFGYETKAHMGNYQESLSNPQNIYANGQRGYRSKYGFGINLEQEVKKDLGAFVRLGWNDGKNQTWEFTDVDRTATAGLSLKGTRWRHADDTLGLGVIVNGISAVHRQYLAAGGLGITVGDGALDYRAERIAETYYNWKIAKHFQLTLDYQFAQNPAYNHVRGPVDLFALRFHTVF